MFSVSNTANDILSSQELRRYLCLFFPDFMVDVIPEGDRDLSLETLGRKLTMPWGAPFMAEEMVRAANMVQDILDKKLCEFIPLWTLAEPHYIPELRKNDRSTVALLRLKGFDGADRKPAVIICPGGAYTGLSMDGEGFQYAQRMEQAGYRAFVLSYRVSPNRYPEGHKDLALAIKHVRYHADSYGIDPESIMLMGSSAGGHLCASFTTDYEKYDLLLRDELRKDCPELSSIYENISCRPNALSLSYPVISFVQNAHEESFQFLTGGEESLREPLSVERHITADYPKTFVWACADDGMVSPQNTELLGAALTKAGVKHSQHIYPQGDHGCGLAAGTSAETWSDEMIAFMKE